MHRILLFILLITSLFAREYIAIIDFEGIGMNENEARVLTQRLTSEMINLEIYQVLERTEMKRLLSEQKFQYSGCVDTKCAVEVGKLLGAKFMIVGSVSKFGSSYSIDCRMINVETSEAYISANYVHEGKIDILLTSGIRSVARQLCELEDTPNVTKMSLQTSPSIPISNPSATLIVNSIPSGAKIKMGDSVLGETPLKLENYPSGEYTINIYLPGYDKKTETFQLVPYGTKNIDIVLVRQTGFIKYNIQPDNATLLMTNKDGQLVVVTSNQTIEAYTGNCNVLIKKPWYYTQSHDIHVIENETTVVTLSLVNGKEDLLKLQRQKKKWFYSAISTTGLATITYLVSIMLYNQYIDADHVQDATDLHKQIELIDGIITPVTAIVSTSIWGYTCSRHLSVRKLKKELSIDE